MGMTGERAWQRLRDSDHGVLSTLHAARGVDAVPVVYAVVGEHVGIPVDEVKPKASTRLQRQRNLEADPRATLLVERWDRDEWANLWWVRAELRYVALPPPGIVAQLSDELAARFVQYREKPFAAVLVLRVEATTGWAAE